MIGRWKLGRVAWGVMLLAVSTSLAQETNRAPVFGRLAGSGFPGTASVTIELPTVDIATVQTTVTVPDRGAIYLGGVKRYSDEQRRAGPFPFLNGRSRSRSAGTTSMTATVLIHNFDELEEDLSWQLADRFRREGNVAEAIAQYRQIGDLYPQGREKAGEYLAALRAEGEAQYEAALASATPGRKLAAMAQFEQVLDHYGPLIRTPQRQAAVDRLAADPEVAEFRHGSEAQANLTMAQEALSRGRPELAKVYYRLAARHPGTQAGRIAALALAQAR